MDLPRKTLSLERCRSLLGGSGVGRLVYTHHALPAVAAVRYRVTGNQLVVAAEPGAEWTGRLAGAVVAFEADSADAQHRIWWSVVVTGQPTRTADGAELDLDRCVVTGSAPAPVG
jgi:nitroimidazol reductase NimA-like FMN-containing flavoprotein (pyridoxamine 5'-phosphate oxidase superfamily)